MGYKLNLSATGVSRVGTIGFVGVIYWRLILDSHPTSQGLLSVRTEQPNPFRYIAFALHPAYTGSYPVRCHGERQPPYTYTLLGTPLDAPTDYGTPIHSGRLHTSVRGVLVPLVLLLVVTCVASGIYQRRFGLVLYLILDGLVRCNQQHNV
jgi:hypothetical protein